ncbi:unnamed protein product [Blepharisma stoltei]|uniref:Uncharacterized protein n=1 Tax=Blepharisma stoltei TaxID=1481888 RepID=A0AAU9JL56_9CILI|nr:unnamed protein product [Blepharisma stoltei]
MGQTKGIYYNFLIIVFVGVIWYFITRNPSYSVYPLPDIAMNDSSELNLMPRRIDLSLIFNRDSMEIPKELQKNITQIRNEFSHLLDVEININFVRNDDMCCKKCHENLDQFRLILKPANIEIRREISNVAIIISEDDCNPIPMENVHYVHPDHLGDISKILIVTLRIIIGLPEADNLINGLTQEERKSANSIAVLYQTTKFNTEIRHFNNLLKLNKPIISFKDYLDIEKARSDIENASKTNDLIELAQAVDLIVDLNSRESLYQEEYFQWDFKVGVYAPIFVPSLFPLGGAIYHKLFMNYKAKLKID